MWRVLCGKNTRVTAVLLPEAVACSFHEVERPHLGAEAHAASRGFLISNEVIAQLGIPFESKMISPRLEGDLVTRVLRRRRARTTVL